MRSAAQAPVGILDLRSDTVTKPCAEMRAAMAAAEVGDDVYGEDPTVAKLEAHVAAMLEKECGLFVPSGTMANLVAAIGHATSRTAFPEIVVGSASHTVRDEVGNLAAVARCHTRQLCNAPDGTIPLEALRSALGAGDDIHYADLCAVFLENTHSCCGGVPLEPAYLNAVAAMCRQRSPPVALHCDGARLWNASVALGVSMAELARPFDSVTVCMSKGIGAPMGSVLVGSKAFVHTARRARKMLGGGLRQVGGLAAAALVGITKNYPRMGEDHALAAHLADTVRPLLAPGEAITPPRTNMFFIELSSAEKTQALVHEAAAAGVLLSNWSERTVRVVTHCNLTTQDGERAAQTLGSLKMWTKTW